MPDQPTVTIYLRVPPELKAAAVAAADAAGLTLQDWIIAAMRAALQNAQKK